MALKIVHLCDVHSTKGEDIPAQYAHTIALDGGTFAIDLCPTCDQERFTPLVAFLDAFGLLTDGAVDPREAVAENLRLSFAAQLASAESKPARSGTRQKERPAPSAPLPSPERSEPPQSAPETTEELAAGKKIQKETRERLPLVRSMLAEAPEGLSLRTIAERLGITDAAAQNAVQLLSAEEPPRAEFIAQRWWAPENVPTEERERLLAARAIVEARNAVPRICPVDGESILGSRAWETHCLERHGVRPAELLGLTCPIDGESFPAPQVLGMHGRRQHDAVHTPQLFAMVDELGDALGVLADIRKRYGKTEQ